MIIDVSFFFCNFNNKISYVCIYMLIERQKISSIKKSNKVLYFILAIYD